ncbi:prephenate dehydratase domain-containing protein [Bartonella grahamii]|uniref:prephenate dehydratase domain-containing protein n=1 Tax=Bartonella grahamii TaxID=33045 RepID=UPI001FEE6F26|nr:prephenate dehydratase domain-containing protein [Bartonella grahamii]
MQSENNTFIYTLGPADTNCAAAAQWWLDNHNRSVLSADSKSRIILYATLEEAFNELAQKKDGYLLSCAAYPDLHTLIFTRLGDMQLFDSFIMPTHSMVLAKRNNIDEIKTVATHPAPQSLVAHQYDKVFANSNADAAVLCKAEEADACITTSVAANRYRLSIVKNFGQVPIAFLLHSLKSTHHEKI